MKHSDFNEIVKEILAQTEHTLVSKSVEYATDEERFHNFFIASNMMNVIPEQALMGMAIKHIVSVVDMVTTLNDRVMGTPNPRLTVPTPSLAYVREKVGDVINYMILLEAMMMERRHSQPVLATSCEDEFRESLERKPITKPPVIRVHKSKKRGRPPKGKM